MIDEPRQRRVGAYAKLLANYASDDAIIEAGEAAELLFCRGLAFCATSDADGYITDAQVVRYVGAGMRDALKRAARLAEVGVWARVDGGYLVRSWTKIHESAEEKGRKLKADRERKRRPRDSETVSVQIPGGIQAEGSPESLSLIQGSTEHDSATTQQVDGSLEGERPEPSRGTAATEPPPKWATPADARCTGHLGVADPGPCRGCKAERERAERLADAYLERQRRDDEARARNCTRCDGVWLLDDGKMTRRKCDHRRSA